MIVEIEATKAPAWQGVFAHGDARANGATELRSTPAENVLCVVARGAGYLVDCTTPSRSEAIECAPIVGVHAIADEGVLVFHDHLRFVAYGQNGLAWKSARVSWDGIRNVRIDGRRIRAEVWNAPTDAFIETELELFS